MTQGSPPRMKIAGLFLGEYQERRFVRCSPVSTLKKKKGQTSDQFGSHHHAMGGLAYAKTPGLGPTVPQPGLFPLSADQPGQHECDFDLSDPEWEATYLPV